MTQTESSRASLEIRYMKAAQDYLDGLPWEHFMESTPHATQREITLESFALVKVHRPDMHVFSELLVQYPLPRRKRPGQVVPDNMVVIYEGVLEPVGSYDLPLQPARPFWMLEYVSKSNKRKDYVDNMRRYERELKVPYYLLFDSDKQKLTLYHHDDKRYVAVKPNGEGRLDVPELDLEAALLDRWVRYWHKGKLLPLPGEIFKELEDMTRRASAAEREAAELRKQVESLRGKKNGRK